MISALYNLKDFGYIRECLEEKGVMVQSGGGSFDILLKNFINKLPDDYLTILFDLLHKHEKRALNYSVLKFVLDSRDDLDEQFLIDFIDVYISEGLEGDLMKYARYRDFKQIEVVINLQ